MPSWWPHHLSLTKIALVALILGTAFVLMHGVSHSWDTGVCNYCRWMAR